MSSQTVAFKLVIEGRVQGVSFRASMKRAADQFGISGWVANLPDGNVEALVRGSKEDVEQIINWSKKGPPRARVDRLSVEETSADLDIFGFRILR